MKVGDKVRLIALPPDLPVGDADPTKAVFNRCLRHDFAVAGFNEIGWAELLVESVTGSIGETIWVEPEFLEPILK
ncbi:MAG TPA: hypothetical protein VNZ03_05195 [Terriglobales bacterium]|jgi:hypothetical protein|nr:hypothetical protein [Terriglobales bacterium]